MFGYLNLNDPAKIAPTEAQEALNCRVDRGFLEYKAWTIDEKINREFKDFEGRRIFVDPASHPSSSGAFPDFGYLFRARSTGNDVLGAPSPTYITGWNPGSGAGNTPRCQPVAYGSQPYPVGTYDYISTL